MRRSVVAPITALLLVGTGFAEWQHYVVDSLSRNLLPRVVVRERTPHLAFYTGAGLEYAVWDAGGWVRDTVDAAASFHNGNPALVFDRDGHPHVAWFRGTPWYAHWDGVGWQREEVDTDSGGDHLSLVLDPAGAPCLAYSKSRGLFSYMLKFAHRDSAGWHPVLLDSVGGVDCVLAIDSQGRFCIAHCESWSSGALFFTAQAESGWVKETVVPGNASQSRMVLDENGDPHISYYWAGGGAYDLRFAERVAGIWRYDIIDPGQQLNKRGWDNWIVRDHAGVFHVSYHAHNELQLRYARGVYGHWEVEVVNAVGGWNLGSSIDLDQQGRPVIAYVHENQAFRLYVSAAYDLTAVGEHPKGTGLGLEPGRPTFVRGMLRLEDRIPETGYRAELTDASGRRVMELVPGMNDVRQLAPGVYFVKNRDSSVRKVVIQK